MAKRLQRPAPVRTDTLHCCQASCPACGRSTWQQYTFTRTLVRLEGVVRVRLHIRICQTPSCAQYHTAYRPEAEGRLALPQHEFGLDVIAEIGRLRYREHRSLPEIHTMLRSRDVPISQRSLTNLLERYDELVAVSVLDVGRLRRIRQAEGRVILALDGLQPQVGQEVLWVLRDCLSGNMLLARSLLSATEADLATLLEEVRDALEVPIGALVSDGQQSIRKAVVRVLAHLAHQLCHFHYLREAARPICEADRQAKKELKKRVRCIRALERSVEERDDAAAQLVRGYAVALRSALSDDGVPPLDAPGLRLQERLRKLAESLQRVEVKRGLRLSSARCDSCSSGR